MSDYPPIAGKTTIAPDVLLTIARLTTQRIDGVSRLCPVPPSVKHLLKKGVQQAEGVSMEVVDDTVYVDLYMALKNDTNVREVSRNVQLEVARSISELVGMNVGSVNIHIEDIDYPVQSKNAEG